MEAEMEVSVMELYLELTVSEGTATITQCYYVDKRANGGTEIEPGPGDDGYYVENVIRDVDFIESLYDNVSSPDYEQHQVILGLLGTTTSGVRYLTYAAQSDGKVYYSTPESMGLTITDRAAQDPKMSQSSSNTGIFLERDPY